jgi:hypothetical protein
VTLKFRVEAYGFKLHVEVNSSASTAMVVAKRMESASRIWVSHYVFLMRGLEKTLQRMSDTMLATMAMLHAAIAQVEALLEDLEEDEQVVYVDASTQTLVEYF